MSRSCPWIRHRTPAGASFASTRPISIRRISSGWLSEAAANAVASTFGVLGAVARRYAHKIPFIVKLNHNELLTYPGHLRPGDVRPCARRLNMAPLPWGYDLFRRSRAAANWSIARAFDEAHELGMATILWVLPAQRRLKKTVDYHASADLTGQANHLGVTIKADIVKQKLPVNNGGFSVPSASARRATRFTPLTTEHLIDLCRYLCGQRLAWGRVGLINSWAASRTGVRPEGGRSHDGRRQQAGRRHGAYQRPQGVSSAR